MIYRLSKSKNSKVHIVRIHALLVSMTPSGAFINRHSQYIYVYKNRLRGNYKASQGQLLKVWRKLLKNALILIRLLRH